ncbi:MAG TPA: energy transducer TonB [Candidatus Baltobacteraceae bacterium]|nr:energy transducer TonB [Candidatus Baltobacteraceae bacterium]
MSRRIAAVVAAALFLVVAVRPIYVRGQAQNQAQNNAQNNEEILRRAKSRVQPIYPELAKRMSISGTVKIEVVVAPNGTVKEARIVGGHPVLASAALDAAKKWRFEPAGGESTGVIDFKFEPPR